MGQHTRVSAELADNLAASAARALGGKPGVQNLQRLSGGASQESWRFRLCVDGVGEPLVLRRAPPGKKPRGFSTIDLATEARLLDIAAAAGVPVPAVRWQLDAADNCGTGYVMSAVDGETIPRRVLDDPQLASARAQLARQCGETLARLHGIPEAKLPDMPCLTAADQLKQLCALYDSFGEQRPVLEIAMRWLDQQQVASAAQGLVHGDFRNGNLIVGQQGLNAVLDWELAHRGDPMEDLGWLCVPSWRFGEIDNPVGGFGSIDDLLSGYESVSGSPVDIKHLQYWQTFGSFKWAVICLLQAFTHLSGQRRSVELAAIGRRVSEAEIDLLQSIAPRDSITPFVPEQARAGVRPSAAELASAVSDFLDADLADSLQGRAAYHARVAINALEIVERDTQLGPAADAAEAERLAGLLGSHGSRHDMNAALCRGIRDARLTAQTPGLVDHLWATTMARLAIDQPNYASYQKLLQHK